jgi:hypothetical protein
VGLGSAQAHTRLYAIEQLPRLDVERTSKPYECRETGFTEPPLDPRNLSRVDTGAACYFGLAEFLLVAYPRDGAANLAMSVSTIVACLLEVDVVSIPGGSGRKVEAAEPMDQSAACESPERVFYTELVAVELADDLLKRPRRGIAQQHAQDRFVAVGRADSILMLLIFNTLVLHGKHSLSVPRSRGS